MTSTTSPGRRGRRAATTRRAARWSGALAGLTVAATAALSLLVAPGDTGATAPAPVHGGQVTDASLGCPGLASGPHTQTRAAVGSIARTGLSASGVVTAPGVSGLVRGAWTALANPAGGAVIRASGPIAAGLFAFRTDTTKSTAAVVGCSAPRAQWWFAGAGAGLDHSSQLTMTNVDTGPAVVDLVVLGPEGEVQTIGTRGITIAPGASHTLALSAIAPQTDDLTVGVLASRGRVVAAVRDRYAKTPGSSTGLEWLAPSQAPARLIRLAGVTGLGAPTVLVANPASLEAVVSLGFSGPDGRFTPQGTTTLNVPPGSVRLLTLDKSFLKLIGKKSAAAVVVHASVPVLATLRQSAAQDTADAAAVEPITGAAVGPILTGATSTVQLTAERGPATASLTAYDAKGAVVARVSLNVPARATVTWTPKKGVYVVVSPSSGSLFGAVTYHRGKGGGIAVVPLTALVIDRLQPPVAPQFG